MTTSKPSSRRRAHLAVPEPLVFDATGDIVGAPVVVMTRLPGNPLPRPTVAGWIGGVLHHVALDRCRRRRHQRSVAGDIVA